MIRTFINVLLLSFFIISCKQKSDKNLKISDLNNNKSEKCEVQKKHSFSDINTKDTFKIIYSCDDLEGPMIFQILNIEGKIIYEEKISGNQFYDYERPWYLYVSDPKRDEDFDPKKMNKQLTDSLHQADIKYIKSRMNNFFNKENFIRNPSSKLEKDYLIEENLDKINDEKINIGFSYKLSRGGGFKVICYSKKLKQILVIADCC
ncbi:hypothetical protein [Mesonia sp. K4-1]|uniref:hypothetical protein n=1 Tax=Mesonia sp. K4-1 TaxID=2602760 RepID=UPI0011CBF1B4|nr:hypothetical protein [Mesonia sp. K4-1]TXK74670.1 hypothetical protein FT986_11270 [Mesonia sp. K4-1]